jgi:hypothetical protein
VVTVVEGGSSSSGSGSGDPAAVEEERRRRAAAEEAARRAERERDQLRDAIYQLQVLQVQSFERDITCMSFCMCIDSDSGLCRFSRQREAFPLGYDEC